MRTKDQNIQYQNVQRQWVQIKTIVNRNHTCWAKVKNASKLHQHIKLTVITPIKLTHSLTDYKVKAEDSKDKR